MKISDDDIEITKKLKNYTPSNKLPKLELSNSFIEGMLDKINESFALGDTDQTTGDILQLVSEACEQGSTHHHQISTSPTPFFSQMRQTVTDSSNGVVADIRSWFPSGKNG